MKTLQEQIIAKQEKIIINLKEVGKLYFLCKDHATKNDLEKMKALYKEAEELESELSALKAQAEKGIDLNTPFFGNSGAKVPLTEAILIEEINKASLQHAENPEYDIYYTAGYRDAVKDLRLGADQEKEKVPTKELFEKVYIRSEADLPKVEDVYYVHIKPDNRVTEWAFHKDASHQEWLKYIDWYLRPSGQEKVTDETLDLQQYVTNCLYFAHVEAMDMHSIDFDKWVEREVDNIAEYLNKEKMKTLQEQIIAKQDELIEFYELLFDGDTTQHIHEAKLKKELSALKAQAEQPSNNRLQSESSANNLKTAEEILKGEMSENLWTFICSYPVSYKSEEKLVEWIIDAMQEYAAQFKAGQEKVTDDVLRTELKRFNDWMCGNQFDGRIPLIDQCIQEYMEYRSTHNK